MKEIQKDEVPILQEILRRVVKGNGLLIEELPPLSELFAKKETPKIVLPTNATKDIIIVRNEEYLPYCETFKEYVEELSITTVHIGKSIDNSSLIKNTHQLKRFEQSGGFKKLFVEQRKKIELREISEAKLRRDATISKWTKWTYWLTFTAALLALGLSIYNFISGSGDN